MGYETSFRLRVMDNLLIRLSFLWGMLFLTCGTQKCVEFCSYSESKSESPLKATLRNHPSFQTSTHYLIHEINTSKNV